MSAPAGAVLTTAGSSLDDTQQKSEGVWHAAWRRFRADRVGLWSLVVVVAFLLLILLASLGLVAKEWQREVGVPNAQPTFMGPAPPQAAGVPSVRRTKNATFSARSRATLRPWRLSTL